MTSIDEFFGNYLRSEDIKAEMTVTVKEVKRESLGRNEEAKDKPVAYFENIEKGLALNKVNSEALADIAKSREIEDWAGTKCVLYVDPNVQFGGKRVGGIRVKALKLEQKLDQGNPKSEQEAL